MSEQAHRPGSLQEGAEHALRGFATTLTMLLTMLVFALGLYASHGALGAKLGGYRAVWPQGWSFFTGLDSRDELVAYRLDDAGQAVPLGQRRAAGAWSWGLDRTADLQFVQLNELAHDVPGNYWRSCSDEGRDACLLADGGSSYAVTEPDRGFLVCGRVVLVIHRPAVLEPKKNTAVADSVASVDVTCAS
jgi:sporulation delaying protein SdpA